MSTNAFARSRPRVRHQRVPRTHSCDHPRFLQLVNELARINEAKKKQEQLEGCGSSGSSAGGAGAIVCGTSSISGNQAVVDCLASCTNDRQSASCGQDSTGNNNTVSPTIIGGPCSGSSSSASGSSCCSGALNSNVAQSSNGYRSLDSNQSTSALHDSYQQQQQQQSNHHHHHHHHHYHHHHHNQQMQQQNQEPHNLGNNLPHQDDRCVSKSSSTANIGYSKQNLVVEQSTSDFSNSNSDLRQDENRSKRKRSANDSSGNSRKNSSSSFGGVSGISKRHKSSPDAIRPLSPSFTKCPICLLDSMDRDPSFTNTCFHLFCYVCIENWTKNKATCPLCRTKFTKIIYNIKSATNYEEKIASPIRRDDDDNMADRIMLEHLSGLNSNSAVSSRNPDEMQFIFENLRGPTDVLLPQYMVNPNQMDHRQGDSLHSFNAVAASANFNSNVPIQFQPTSYPPSNYILTFQPNRITPTSTAITGAYAATNTSLTNLNTDPSTRRLSRSGRFSYNNNRANYEAPVDAPPSRVSRTSTISTHSPTGIPIERQHHHQHQHQHHQHQQQHQHQHQNQHPHHHQHNPHRSTLDMSSRQNQRIEQAHNLPLPSYPIQPRHYTPHSVYSRRPYPQVDHQQLLDSLYRHLPDM